MANKVTITRQWPDHDVVSVCVVAENAYPDALDQARKIAVDTFRDALGIATAEVDEP